MKLKSYSKSAILAVVVSINLVMPAMFSEHSKSTAQTVNRTSRARTKARSLPPRGVPGNRTAAVSRGDGCDSSGEELIGLAPEFTQTNPDEDSVWGQTASERPTFWFFMPYTNRTSKLEFSLQDDREENIYLSSIPAPQRPGIISVQIPVNRKPLQVNKKYRWKLTAKIYCDKGVTEKYAIGWVSRVNSSYANEIWYDSATTLARQLLIDPNNVQLRQDWNDLLNSADLGKVARQPLLK